MVETAFQSVTLDELRALVAVVEEGSFSAAARKLRRVQSAVSTAMANLESQLGVTVWDRATRVPRLTAEGRAVVAAARRVLGQAEEMRGLASKLAGGLEASASLCIDALFPVDALLALCRGFAQAFPTVDLRIDSEVMSAVSSRVLRGASTLGVVSQRGLLPGLERLALTPVRMLPVVSAKHALAKERGRIAIKRLAEFTQIVLSERSDPGVLDEAVLSPRTWRIADLHTKHMMLRAGLGWGNLPEHVIHDDLQQGRMVLIAPAPWGENEHTLYLSAIYQLDATLGPAHRWILEQLPVLCSKSAPGTEPRQGKRRKRR